MNKKGQTNFGLLVGLVMAVTALIIGIIIALTITSTLSDANLLGSADTQTLSVINETDGFINITGYQLGTANSSRTNFAITESWNITTTPVLILAANYTVTNGGVVTNSTTLNFADVNFTYTFTFTNPFGSKEQESVDKLSANFTEGINRIGEKVPTVLLIMAIVVILSVLAILVGVWKRLNIGGQGTL